MSETLKRLMLSAIILSLAITGTKGYAEIELSVLQSMILTLSIEVE